MSPLVPKSGIVDLLDRELMPFFFFFTYFNFIKQWILFRFSQHGLEEILAMDAKNYFR